MLTCDTREPAQIWQYLMSHLQPSERVRALIVAADYVLEQGTFCLPIERKAVSDLITSWLEQEEDAEGRPISKLRRQLYSCRTHYNTPVAALLVEGSYRKDELTGDIWVGNMLRKASYQGLQRLLLDLQDEGFRVIHTNDKDQTAATLLALYESYRRPPTWSQSLPTKSQSSLVTAIT